MKKIIIQKPRSNRITKEVTGQGSYNRTITLHKLSSQIESIQLRETHSYSKKLLEGQVTLREYDCLKTPPPPREDTIFTGGFNCCDVGCPDCDGPTTPTPTTPSPTPQPSPSPTPQPSPSPTPQPSPSPTPQPSPSPTPQPSPTPAPTTPTPTGPRYKVCCGCNELGPVPCWIVPEFCEGGLPCLCRDFAPENVRHTFNGTQGAGFIQEGESCEGYCDAVPGPGIPGGLSVNEYLCEQSDECCLSTPQHKWTCCPKAATPNGAPCDGADNRQCYTGTPSCKWHWVPEDPCQPYCDPNSPVYDECIEIVNAGFECDIGAWPYSPCCDWGASYPFWNMCDCVENGQDSPDCNFFYEWDVCESDTHHSCEYCSNGNNWPWDGQDPVDNDECNCPCEDDQYCMPGVASKCQCPIATSCCGCGGPCSDLCDCSPPCNSDCLCQYELFPGGPCICRGSRISYGGCLEECDDYWPYLGSGFSNPPDLYRCPHVDDDEGCRCVGWNETVCN